MREVRAVAHSLGVDASVLEKSPGPGHCAGHRGYQGSNRCALRRERPTGYCQSSSHKRSWTRRATANSNDGRPRSNRSGGSHLIMDQIPRSVLARRWVGRQDFAWGKAWRLAGRAGDAVRSRHQSGHGRGTRLDDPANTARPRRRGDRVAACFAAVPNDAIGMSGGSRMSALTPLLEAERTFVGRAENAAFDPQPT